MLKKAYWVCIYEQINNTEKLKEYAVKAKPAIEKFSGKFLVRGGKNRTNDGIESPRTVVVEFPDYNTAINCYASWRCTPNSLGHRRFDEPDDQAKLA